MLWRRRSWEGRQQFFLTARPVPLRIAGYNPVEPEVTGRVPTPAFPPANPVYEPKRFIGPPPPYFPPTHIPPVYIPPGPPEPPCDLDDDDNPETECDPDEPKEPPTDVPEPGMLILLATGALTYRFMKRRKHRQ